MLVTCSLLRGLCGGNIEVAQVVIHRLAGRKRIDKWVQGNCICLKLKTTTPALLKCHVANLLNLFPFSLSTTPCKYLQGHIKGVQAISIQLHSAP